MAGRARTGLVTPVYLWGPRGAGWSVLAYFVELDLFVLVVGRLARLGCFLCRCWSELAACMPALCLGRAGRS